MDSRLLAFNIYRKTIDGGGIENKEIKNIPAENVAFVKRLVQMTLRRQEFLKQIINKFMRQKIIQKPNNMQILLLLAAVEILYFDTPDYAVVNSYVALAKKINNKYAAGFVNAVLHKICYNKEKIVACKPLPFFPFPFRKMLQSSYCSKKIDSIETAALKEPDLDITVREDPEFWCRKLGGKLLGNGTVRLKQTGNISALDGFAQGAWWVQDFSSSLPVIALKDIKNKTVLDLCAAPGGKTAQLIARGALVTAVDISQKRLKILEENLERLNLKAQNIIAADALQYLNNCSQFDIVLVDAPCSADGTLRRHPEIVHTRNIDDVKKNALLQHQLLAKAAKAVKNKGKLMYAVCSMCKQEGEQQIDSFISNYPNFKIFPILTENINPFHHLGYEKIITEKGFIRCLPDMLEGMDGFFAACLQKISE